MDHRSDSSSTAAAGPASYSSVCILKPGVFNAGSGVTVSLDKDQLALIADNFDPDYLLPTINLDHNDRGPALGRVEALHFDGEFLRKLERLELLAKKIFRGLLRGEHTTSRRGRGLEFSDFRRYRPGDDFRHIDWNIYSRLDRLFLKLCTISLVSDFISL